MYYVQRKLKYAKVSVIVIFNYEMFFNDVASSAKGHSIKLLMWFDFIVEITVEDDGYSADHTAKHFIYLFYHWVALFSKTSVQTANVIDARNTSTDDARTY